VKVLVTGMTSRHCNPERSLHDVSVSWLIAEACRSLGYEVEHRNPTLAEDVATEFDHIFIGIAPPHALGANRIYGAMSALLRGWGANKVSLYIDDPDVTKIVSGVRTQFNDPARFLKQLYNYRLEYETATQPEWRDWLWTGVKYLHENAWPTTILPVFPWAPMDKWQKKLPNATSLHGVDLSGFMPTFDFEDAVERQRRWISESPADGKWMRTVRPVLDVQRYGSKKKGLDSRPDDKGLVDVYRGSWGVVEEPTLDGWWSSRIGYAAASRALYVSRWQDVMALGEPYGVLTDAAAEWDLETRDAWAEAQAVSFERVSTPRAAAQAFIESIVKGS
jgi:hypothetical protein